MPQDVYADLLFLINFSMDYLCLYICAKIMRRKMRLPRMLIASIIGGIYSVVSLFIPSQSIISLIIDALVCIVMCAIVFSEPSRRAASTLLCSFLYVGISMMTGGCMTAIFNLLNRQNWLTRSYATDKRHHRGITLALNPDGARITGIAGNITRLLQRA